MQCQNERTETNQEMEWQIKHIEEKQEEIQSQLISILAVSFLLLNLVRSGVELIQDSINFLTCIGAGFQSCVASNWGFEGMEQTKIQTNYM